MYLKCVLETILIGSSIQTSEAMSWIATRAGLKDLGWVGVGRTVKRAASLKITTGNSSLRSKWKRWLCVLSHHLSRVCHFQTLSQEGGVGMVFPGGALPACRARELAVYTRSFPNSPPPVKYEQFLLVPVVSLGRQSTFPLGRRQPR